MDVDPAAGLNAERSSNVLSTAYPLEESPKTVSDAVSIDEGMPESKVGLGSGKQRRKKKKVPELGIASEQNIQQVNQSLDVGDRIQGNFMDVDPAAELNAARSSNIFSTTLPLEKSQKTVSDAANATVSIDEGMQESKVGLGSGKRRRKKKKGPKLGIASEQNIQQANHSLEVGDIIEENFMDPHPAAGLNAARNSNIFSTTLPLEKSQKTVSDAANASIDEGMPESKVGLGSGKRKQKKKKGPKLGIASEQNIQQANQSLDVGDRIQGNDPHPTAGLNAARSSNIFSTTLPLEESRKTVSDAANATVSIDEGMPESKVCLGSGKRKRKKKNGPKLGIASEQNIQQANQSLEVGDRIQGNFMDMDSAAGLNALEKSQKTVSDAANATVSIDKGMPQSKVELGLGKRRWKKGPKFGISSVQNINQANQSLEVGDEIQGNFMDVDSAAGLNAECSSNILSTAHPLEKSPKTVQSRTENKADSFDLSVTTASQQDSRFFANKEPFLPIEQHGVKGPSEFVSQGQGISNGVYSGFFPRPFAPAVYRRNHQYLTASEFMHGEQLLHSRRSEQHVNGVEGSQVMYWDASYGANPCYVPRSIAPVVNSRRKLLVLDINGLLADIVMPSPKGRRADKHILGRAVFKRPFYYEFLVFCCKRFDVGIWSSRSKKVIDKLVDYLLGDLKTKLLFCWNKLHCTVTSFKTLENKDKPLVFKELRKLWEKDDPSLPWERGYYNKSNTVLLDDSPYKALLNPINTAIFPKSFQYKNKKNKSLGPGGDLRIYLEGLAATDDDVRKFIAQHPFGQGAIDARSPKWGFYSNVIRSCSVQDAQKC